MEASTEGKKLPNNKVLLAVSALLLAAALVVSAVMLGGRKEEEDDSGRIGYSTDAVVVLDEASLQAAMDEAAENANNGNVALWYQNNAYSQDGTHFDCFIGNSKANLYDCFLNIYADAELTDELFLSALVPPGSGFEEITLNHPLEEGDHSVYVVVTLVTDEDGEQVMKGQVVHTVDFHVSQLEE